jgi:hypothetical protein
MDDLSGQQCVQSTCVHKSESSDTYLRVAAFISHGYCSLLGDSVEDFLEDLGRRGREVLAKDMAETLGKFGLVEVLGPAVGGFGAVAVGAG